MHAPSLQDLQAFAAVARLGSFRRAAVVLGVTPSALSHTLKALESRLGLRLLHRTTRSVSPTEAGQQLLQRLAPALDDIAIALDELNQHRASPAGTLRLNAPQAAVQGVLPSLVQRFLARHPQMRLEVVSDDALVDIVAAGFDAGVRFGESLQQDMVAHPMGPPQRFVVVASPDFLARHGRPQSPHALTRLPCIRVRFPSGSHFRWEFVEDGRRLQIDVDGPLSTDDFALMHAAAEQGLGLCYAYDWQVAARIADGRLLTVLDAWMPPPEHFWCYHPSRRLVPAGLRAWIDLLAEDAVQQMWMSPPAPMPAHTR
jgi:DNA-binding transcriptional LysR family regulator